MNGKRNSEEERKEGQNNNSRVCQLYGAEEGGREGWGAGPQVGEADGLKNE